MRVVTATILLTTATFVAGVVTCIAACGGGEVTLDNPPGGSPDGSGGDGASSGADGGAPTAEAGADAAPSCPAPSIALGAHRGSDVPSFVRGSYDYAPSVMHDGKYRMWWCGGVAGDYILHAEADSLDGPWHARSSSTPGTYDTTMQPTGADTFDGAHTCDPSVIRVDGVYYMYYGGLGIDNSAQPLTTRLGVARSSDGLSWQRLNGGAAIFEPVRPLQGNNKYGAGQPSVTYVDGYFTLVYTDTSGVAVDGNGGGQFVVRSRDPAFASGVEVLGASGFTPRTTSNATTHSLLPALGVDWQFVDALDMWAVAVDAATNRIEVHLFDHTLTREVTKVDITGAWHEGPGLVGRPDRHLEPATRCGAVPFDVMRALGPDDVNTWDLGHVGTEVTTGESCACSALPRAFEGTLIAADARPLTMVRDGRRLQFAASTPALTLARTGYTVSAEIFDAIPFGASMPTGATVLGATGRPAGFLLDANALWPVDCGEAITANGSTIATVSVAEWDGHPQGPALHCVR